MAMTDQRVLGYEEDSPAVYSSRLLIAVPSVLSTLITSLKLVTDVLEKIFEHHVLVPESRLPRFTGSLPDLPEANLVVLSVAFVDIVSLVLSRIRLPSVRPTACTRFMTVSMASLTPPGGYYLRSRRLIMRRMPGTGALSFCCQSIVALFAAAASFARHTHELVISIGSP